MAPTKEELELGVRAYHRVRRFDLYGERHMRQTPWILAACTVCIMLLAVVFQKPFNGDEIAVSLVFLAGAFLWNWAQRRIAKDTYAQQKLILRLLYEKYGNALPWVAEEEQLALAEGLQRAIRHRLS